MVILGVIFPGRETPSDRVVMAAGLIFCGTIFLVNVSAAPLFGNWSWLGSLTMAEAYFYSNLAWALAGVFAAAAAGLGWRKWRRRRANAGAR